MNNVMNPHTTPIPTEIPENSLKIKHLSLTYCDYYIRHHTNCSAQNKITLMTIF